jgi:hypothetical protein
MWFLQLCGVVASCCLFIYQWVPSESIYLGGPWLSTDILCSCVCFLVCILFCAKANLLWLPEQSLVVAFFLCQLPGGTPAGMRREPNWTEPGQAPGGSASPRRECTEVLNFWTRPLRRYYTFSTSYYLPLLGYSFSSSTSVPSPKSQDSLMHTLPPSTTFHYLHFPVSRLSFGPIQCYDMINLYPL